MSSPTCMPKGLFSLISSEMYPPFPREARFITPWCLGKQDGEVSTILGHRPNIGTQTHTPGSKTQYFLSSTGREDRLEDHCKPRGDIYPLKHASPGSVLQRHSMQWAQGAGASTCIGASEEEREIRSNQAAHTAPALGNREGRDGHRISRTSIGFYTDLENLMQPPCADLLAVGSGRFLSARLPKLLATKLKSKLHQTTQVYAQVCTRGLNIQRCHWGLSLSLR